MTDSTEINQLPTGEQTSAPTHVPPYNPHQPELQNGPLQASQQTPQQPSTQYNPNPPQQPQPNHPQQSPTQSEPLSQEIIQQLIDGVQRASSTGATRLPSRDIPQDTTQMTIDQHQKPNYVPGNGANEPPSIHNRDYIEQYDTMETMLAEQKRREAKTDRLNEIYEEIQTPVLVVVLFFIFQLPFVSKTFQTYTPNLWVEGKPTLGAYLIQASAFGAVYYGISQIIQWLSVV